ncbi:MAG TPA: hypothetical protein VGI81_07205 [Tepidisphaeraceae bacterium]
MFDEPSESPAERAADPKEQAKEKSDELRMHAELVAVFEGTRKFDAQLAPNLDGSLAREIQRTMAKLEKSKAPDSPILPPPSLADAADLLNLAQSRGLSTNDYHIARRPGEVMIVRWLQGEEVEKFYERLQAHFDAAMNAYREEERQSNEWKQDPKTLAYLAALDELEVKLADRYLRDLIRRHNLFVLSTQTADELNVAYLADYVMSVSAAEIVGSASAPPDVAPTERDLAWFFKLFSLRGLRDGVEQMCFFTFLQKTDEGW